MPPRFAKNCAIDQISDHKSTNDKYYVQSVIYQ